MTQKVAQMFVLKQIFGVFIQNIYELLLKIRLTIQKRSLLNDYQSFVLTF